MKKPFALLAAACLVFAQETVDQSVNTRIRQEAMEHSQVMHTAAHAYRPLRTAPHRVAEL